MNLITFIAGIYFTPDQSPSAIVLEATVIWIHVNALQNGKRNLQRFIQYQFLSFSQIVNYLHLLLHLLVTSPAAETIFMKKACSLKDEIQLSTFHKFLGIFLTLL